jgi:DNA-directed RNA polymerase specialized sigma24 family protein
MVRALARLPRRQRAVVVLRYWEDLTETQVAGVMGCSVGTVRSQAHRALAKLRVSPELTEAAAERDNAPCTPLDEAIGRPKETAA